MAARWPLYLAAASAGTTAASWVLLNDQRTPVNINANLQTPQKQQSAITVATVIASLKGPFLKQRLVEAGCVETLVNLIPLHTQLQTAVGDQRTVQTTVADPRTALVFLMECDEGRGALLKMDEGCAGIIQRAEQGSVDLSIVARLLKSEQGTSVVLNHDSTFLHRLASLSIDSPLAPIAAKGMENVASHSVELLFDPHVLNFVTQGLQAPNKQCRGACQAVLVRLVHQMEQDPQLYTTNFAAWEHLQPLINSGTLLRAPNPDDEINPITASHVFKVFGSCALGGMTWGMVRGRSLLMGIQASKGSMIIGLGTFLHATAFKHYSSGPTADHNTELIGGGTASIVTLLTTWGVLQRMPFSFGGFVIGVICVSSM